MVVCTHLVKSKVKWHIKGNSGTAIAMTFILTISLIVFLQSCGCPCYVYLPDMLFVGL